MLKSIKKTNLLMMSSIILFMAFITIYLFRNCDFNDVIYEIETLASSKGSPGKNAKKICRAIKAIIAETLVKYGSVSIS